MMRTEALRMLEDAMDNGMESVILITVQGRRTSLDIRGSLYAQAVSLVSARQSRAFGRIEDLADTIGNIDNDKHNES